MHLCAIIIIYSQREPLPLYYVLLCIVIVYWIWYARWNTEINELNWTVIIMSVLIIRGETLLSVVIVSNVVVNFSPLRGDVTICIV